MRLLLVLLIFGFFIGPGMAQEKLSGKVFENKTDSVLAGIKIVNLRSQAITISRADGTFSIAASAGDVLSFSNFDYQTDSVYISNSKFLQVFLEPKYKMLKEVKVITPETNPGSLKIPVDKGPLNSQTVLYQTDDAGNYKGGLQIMLVDGNGNEKKREKARKNAADEATEIEITNLFSPQTIQNYLPVRNQELANFIILYKPDLKTYRDKGFNLLMYLNTSYKEFLKIPAEQRSSKTYLQLTDK